MSCYTVTRNLNYFLDIGCEQEESHYPTHETLRTVYGVEILGPEAPMYLSDSPKDGKIGKFNSNVSLLTRKIKTYWVFELVIQI